MVEESPAKKCRSRNDRRREITRTALLEKAETMFAEYGIDAVSLRQLRQAIGSSNTNVVTYYFGSKEGLIEELIAYRLPTIEARRAELFSIASQDGLADQVESLIRVLWQPLFELVDRNGHHPYARFLGKLGLSEWIDSHPLPGGLFKDSYPVTSEIHKRLLARFPRPLTHVYLQRLIINSMIIAGSLEYIDYLYSNDSLNAQFLFGDALRTATGAMLAPFE